MPNPEMGGMSEAELKQYMTPEQKGASDIHDERYGALGKGGTLEKKSYSGALGYKITEVNGEAHGVKFQLKEMRKAGRHDDDENAKIVGTMGDGIELSPEDARQLWNQFKDTPMNSAAKESEKAASDSQFDYNAAHATEEDLARDESERALRAEKVRGKYENALSQLRGEKASDE